MSKPTLLVKGSLRAPNDDPALQARMDEVVPYEYIIQWIRAREKKTGLTNRVLVLKAETASGKSTALIAELYREFMVKPGAAVRGSTAPSIICTQPRTLTAIRNIVQLVDTADYGTFLTIGETVGWSTRFNKLRARRYGLLSATVGTLLRQLDVWTDEEIMTAYRFILIDETHERDLETDMVLMMLKNLLLRQADNPAAPFVVLMSATFEPEHFLQYYGLTTDNYIWVEGRAFGIVQHWDWNSDRVINDYPRTAATIVGRIVRNEDDNEPDEPERGDILIFMPGTAEINLCEKWLAGTNAALVAEGHAPVSVLKIDSMAQREENISFRLLDIPLAEHQVRVGRATFTAGRRVVISTNIAETGLTIPSLKYVIDSGYNKEVEFNPNLGLSSLIVRPAPQSRIRQRMGRAGRKFRGHFYPLYPEYLYNRLPVNQLPNILLGDTSRIMLGIITEQLRYKSLTGAGGARFSTADIDMVDVPAPDSLWYAMEKLYALGFIAPQSIPYSADMLDAVRPSSSGATGTEYVDGMGLTRLGVLANQMRMVSPESVRMILAGYTWGASILDLITIAAYLAVGPRSLEGALEVEEDEIEGGSEIEGGDGEFEERDGGDGEFEGGAPRKTSRRSTKRTAAAAAAASKSVSTATISAPKAVKSGRVRPGIDWVKLYALGEPGFLGGRGQLYRTRLLIGDEFIDSIFILGATKRLLAAVPNNDMFTRLREWAIEYNINWSGLMAFLAARDDIIDQMLVAGFDVFANESAALVDTHPSNFIDTVTRLKHCIYEGYRLNILRRGPDGYYRFGGSRVVEESVHGVVRGGGVAAERVRVGGVVVQTPSLFKKDEHAVIAESEFDWTLNVEPTTLLYNELSVKLNSSGYYDVLAGAVSVMDGFVNVDETFLDG